MTKTHIVWFKRDLRVHDHAPLAAACTSGEPVLALYIFEPELWSGPDGTARQLGFLKQSLTELSETLEERGAQLVIRSGEAAEVFSQLHRDFGIAAIHTHRDAQSGPEAKRTDAVRRWALRAGVSLREQEAANALRHLGATTEWRGRWYGHVTAPRRLAPEFIFSAFARSDDIDSIQLPHLQEGEEAPAPPGGRSHAVRLLRRAFVAGDAHTFRDVLRALKQHIGMGTISIRETVQAALRAKRIGSPGQNLTYAETLIDRLRDDCERQHRLAQRAGERPFADAPMRRGRRSGNSSLRSQPKTNRSAPADQLSLKFLGDDQPWRQA